MFSSTTTELSIKREKTSASPPSTMVLMVPPPRLMAAEMRPEPKTVSKAGPRSLPRTSPGKSESSRRSAPGRSSLHAQVADRRLHILRLIEDDLGDQGLRHVDQVLQLRSCTPSTIAIVLLLPPCFRTGRYTDFWPSTRTMLVLDRLRVLGVANVAEAKRAVADRLQRQVDSYRRCQVVALLV